MLITDRAQLLAEVAAGTTDLQLADGNYGSLTVFRHDGVQITGGPGAILTAANISESDDFVLDGITVFNTPTSTSSNAVRLYQVHNGLVRGVAIRGQLVPEGTPLARHATDTPAPGQNALLVGYYAGRALSLESVDGVIAENCDITGFLSGINFSGDNVTVRNNLIYRLRTTAIKGGANNLLIEDNQSTGSTPYRYFNTATGKEDGDHLDGIHVYSDVDEPMVGLMVRHNLIDASEGFGMLGINIQTKSGGPITGSIEDNLVITANNQAITLATLFLGNCDGNTVYAPPGSAIPACIVVKDRTRVTMHGNTSAEASTKPTMASSYPDNTWLSRSPAAALQSVIDAAKVAFGATAPPVDPPPPPDPEPEPEPEPVYVTPAERTVTVDADVREHLVRSEERTRAIAAETRTYRITATPGVN